MKVLIVGGGIVGSFLARLLSEKNEVAVVEQNLARVETLREEMPEVKVIAEDGCEPWVLESTVRDEAMMMPKAETVLRIGDKVLAITSVRYKKELEELLGHRGRA